MHQLTPTVTTSKTREEGGVCLLNVVLIAAAEPKTSAGVTVDGPKNMDNASTVQEQVEVGPTPVLCSD